MGGSGINEVVSSMFTISSEINGNRTYIFPIKLYLHLHCNIYIYVLIYLLTSLHTSSSDLDTITLSHYLGIVSTINHIIYYIYIYTHHTAAGMVGVTVGVNVVDPIQAINPDTPGVSLARHPGEVPSITAPGVL